MVGYATAQSLIHVSVGAFWLAFAATLTPMYNAEAAFTAGATTAAEKAKGVASFQSSLGKLGHSSSAGNWQLTGERSLLPAFYGACRLHVPHLLAPHKHRLLLHLSVPRHCFAGARRGVLESRRG